MKKKWPAPAKLNLMLRITGQREDGYHLLQTVFQFIDLCDWLQFTPVMDDRVYLKNPIPGVPESDDLTVRAANLLKQETGYAGGVCSMSFFFHSLRIRENRSMVLAHAVDANANQIARASMSFKNPGSLIAVCVSFSEDSN